METVFVQLGTDYLRESLEPETMIARGNVGQFDAPSGVYRCHGEDGYCAVAVDGDTDWIKLATAIGRNDLAYRSDLSTADGRLAHREELDRAVEAWATLLESHDAAAQLQAVGVAAGAAAHVKDLLDDPQLAHRHALGSTAATWLGQTAHGGDRHRALRCHRAAGVEPGTGHGTAHPIGLSDPF